MFGSEQLSFPLFVFQLDWLLLVWLFLSIRMVMHVVGARKENMRRMVVRKSFGDIVY